MVSTAVYRTFIGYLLVGLFLLPLGIQLGHMAVGTHATTGYDVHCTADSYTPHAHDTDQQHQHHCLICAFHYHQVVVGAVATLAAPLPSYAEQTVDYAMSWHRTLASAAYYLRGPPRA